MDKFSIDDSDSEEHSLNPLFIKSLPRFTMNKGTLIERLPSGSLQGFIFKERKGFAGLFIKSRKKVARWLGFEDEFLYGYEKVRNGFIVNEAWHLRRLFKLDITKENRQHMLLHFINKTLNPAHSIKIKEVQIQQNALFVQQLQIHLNSCDIDLEA
jgi:hypothetical protein